MQIQNTETLHTSRLETNSRNSHSSNNFSGIFKNQTLTAPDSVEQSLPQSSDQDSIRQESGTTILKNNINLGSLTQKNTTVAHLLLANPELKANTWSIIHNPVNENKVFKQIPAGSQIYYNKQSGELSWNTNLNNQSLLTGNSTHRQIINYSQTSDSSAQNSSNKSGKEILGIINKQVPTVSNLLSNNNNYKSERWDIIHSAINKHKSFTRIPDGATIYIDKTTKEISWAKAEKQLTQASPSSTTVSSSNAVLSNKLDDAVKPFMGTPYKNLDCYTLVVNGLENMGIEYRGKNGLRSQLLQMARAESRVKNAYFTGEGITQAMGKKVYTKAVFKVNDINQQSKDIYQEMKNLMQKGDILSFSLGSKGHTGVISQHQEQWTYINSGRLDHSINKNAPKHGVGEENLLDEISNWIKLSQRRKEYLQITIGRVDSNKLA